MNKLILTGIVTILLATGIFALFCVFTGNIETLSGVLLALASFAIVLWCFSLGKDARPSLGIIVLVLAAIILLPSTTLAIAGVEPFASGKDTLLSNASAGAKSVASSAGEIIPSPHPSGKYTTHKIEGKASVIFKGDNTLEMDDAINGLQIYEYKIFDDGEKIQITDVATDKTTVLSFNHVKDYGIVTIDSVDYYREN